MNLFIGLVLAVMGGAIQGAFVYPQKFMKNWKYENGWFVFTVMCCLVLPLVLAFATTPDLMEIYRNTPSQTMWLVFLSGMAWGVGVILFGLGADFLGMALGIAIITALNAAFGTLLPLFLLPSEESLSTTAVLVLIAGLLVLIGGVIQVAKAGKIRDKETTVARKVSFRVGLIVCIVAAIFCPATNFAVFFGKPITESVIALGTVAPYNVGYAQLLPYFIGGFIVNTIYCVYLFVRNKSFKVYAAKEGRGRNFMLGTSMALLFIVGMAFYTIANASFIPAAGAVIGWPLFMAATIIAGQVLGLSSGEWKGVDRKAFRELYIGIALLIVAIIIVSLSNLF